MRGFRGEAGECGKVADALVAVRSKGIQMRRDAEAALARLTARAADSRPLARRSGGRTVPAGPRSVSDAGRSAAAAKRCSRPALGSVRRCHPRAAA